ncbi:transposable element Tcb1 transposase [Trichonephila clavipes]|nr:transposable element Tcb1 transposase [Trichonephila clavipes]
MRLLRHRDKRTLATCIYHRLTGLSLSVMVWSAVRYTSRPPLVRINGTLNSERYISGVLRNMALPFIRALRNATFQQDTARTMLPLLYRPFLIQKMLGCCPALYVHQI